MELVYLWVEDYKNIRQEGFNFSPRFECKFNNEYDDNEKLKDICTLDIKPKEHIENFFGNNINITAIIGENGSGKSTILELLFNKYNHTTLEKGLFFIYFDKNTDKLIFLGANETKINDSKYKIEMQYKMETLASTKTVYFSNILNENDLFLPKYESNVHHTHSVNISTTHRLSQMKLIETSSQESSVTSFDKIYRSYRIQQISNTLILIKDKAIEIPFDLPIRITLKNIDFRTFLKTLMLKPTAERYREILNILHDNNTDNEIFNNYLSINLIISLLLENTNDNLLEKELLRKVLGVKLRTYELESFYDEVKEKIYNTQWENDTNLEYKNYIDNFFDLADQLIEQIDSLNLDETNSQVEMKLTIDDIDFSFLETYEQLIQQSEYFWDIGFDRGLSSGEENFLYQFSRFYQLSKGFQENEKENLKIKEGKEEIEAKNIIFLIDEGEDTLHPRWQKKYIEYLTKFFRDNFEQNIHIIVTSHSPFIVSDLPKGNILFMKDGKEDKGVHKQTFGANIHTLLSDGFFMDEGLIGKFAENKIQEIMNFLYSESEIEDFHISQQQIKLTIESIGEDLLRMKLLDMYYDKFEKDELEKEKLQLIEKQKEITELINSIQKKQKK